MRKKNKYEKKIEEMKEIMDSNQTCVCEVKVDGKKVMGVPYEVGPKHISLSLVRLMGGDTVRDLGKYDIVDTKSISYINITGILSEGSLKPYNIGGR